MGLDVKAKGLTAETGFSCGYITYGKFVAELVKVAYGERCCDIFWNTVVWGKEATAEEVEHWNEKCNDDLDILIMHSDCDGKFTPKECRKIYNAMKDLYSDMQGHNYGVMKSYNMFEHWKAIFKHCADRRVNLYYT